MCRSSGGHGRILCGWGQQTAQTCMKCLPADLANECNL
ncbi:hypothetical protein Z948_517 [Sulfitobacter donghicola DSW-25 = KCTC 12864 = JCM 14565]|nr:hypothetical protein Z948_517 [Sulfitobacter donghicola DSW-25 = KCTC 12864 = JCM 14565]